MKIKTGDNVVVISGKDKGKKGKVLEAIPTEDRILVEKVALVKKHRKARGNAPAGIIEVESPIHVSNVKILCQKTGKSSRVAYGRTTGKKFRVAKVSGATIETPFVKK